MNNNIFLPGGDPLLYRDSYHPSYPQIFSPPPTQLTSIPPQRDHLTELDRMMKSLGVDMVAALSDNKEFQSLNEQLSSAIRDEIMILVKDRLNNNPTIISNTTRQIEIIRETEASLKEEEKKNISDLNDYLKNYSHLTFDEYKNIKSNNETTRNKTTNSELL